ncbi:hypothetical protein WN72_04440 [Bradyrhizobium arachidis]|uniref:Uncharacterized protein n=1 Tax=Bradyrhizobium arachidis TaxID=858423 RepID=A0AAE7NIR2_9BRAD|nr:hypothetical protein WN72_04440 [Bradyrhizobium arachidis]
MALTEQAECQEWSDAIGLRNWLRVSGRWRTFARADGGAAFQVPGRSVRFSERAMVPREGITHNHRHSELLSILNELLFILNMVP